MEPGLSSRSGVTPNLFEPDPSCEESHSLPFGGVSLPAIARPANYSFSTEVDSFSKIAARTVVGH